MSPAGAFVLSCTAALCAPSFRPVARASGGASIGFAKFSMGPPLSAQAGEGEQMSVETRFGTVRYRSFGERASSPQVLFVHGLGSSSQTAQPPADLLQKAGFLVPDLLGHGESACPANAEAFRMQSQAEAVVAVLEQEPSPGELFLIAHSLGGGVCVELCEMLRRKGTNVPTGPAEAIQGWQLSSPTSPNGAFPYHTSLGGPVCVELCEMLRRKGKNVAGMVYAEGNLNAGDCFGSAKLVSKGVPAPPAEGASAAQQSRYAFDTAKFHSSVDLVQISGEGTLLPRIQALRAEGMRVAFVYGGENRGRFTSEQLLSTEGEEIVWIEKGAHSMHADEGYVLFWNFVAGFVGTAE